MTGKRVIVIDDERDNADVFSEYLSLCDFEVLATGYDGKSAVELYEKLGPDIVFLDLMMPEYDGFYALEKIKQFDPHAKIIIVTADIRSSSVSKAQKLGADAIVCKPFKIDEIFSIVKRLDEVSAL